MPTPVLDKYSATGHPSPPNPTIRTFEFLIFFCEKWGRKGPFLGPTEREEMLGEMGGAVHPVMVMLTGSEGPIVWTANSSGI